MLLQFLLLCYCHIAADRNGKGDLKDLCQCWEHVFVQHVGNTLHILHCNAFFRMLVFGHENFFSFKTNVEMMCKATEALRREEAASSGASAWKNAFPPPRVEAWQGFFSAHLHQQGHSLLRLLPPETWETSVHSAMGMNMTVEKDHIFSKHSRKFRWLRIDVTSLWPRNGTFRYFRSYLFMLSQCTQSFSPSL